MQSVGQYAGLYTDLWHAQALVKQRLHLRLQLKREFAARPRLGRLEKRRRARRAIKLRHAFYRAQRHPEGAHDLALRGRAVHDQLRGKEPEGRQIALVMAKDGQMTVQIHHFPIPALRADRIINRDHSCRKHR
ncbi:MAG: hypothetical protein H2172_11010 [Opitutus sp.]|nr:hypothetical protein [Opitutus sp.]MCS6276879.1 hypothetical protein [Opitutus sp.]